MRRPRSGVFPKIPESAGTVERDFIGCFNQLPRSPYAMPAHAAPSLAQGAIPLAAKRIIGVDPASLSKWRD
jgi:hypothetical protein